MTMDLPIKVWYALGDGTNAVTRRAVSYTPASAITLRHLSFVGRRTSNPSVSDYATNTLVEVETIGWEIRTAVATNKPGTAASTLLTSGTFDFRYSTSWKLDRPIKYTINLATPVALSASTQYWFILKMPTDEVAARYILEWATTYETGASGEVVATVYVSNYAGSWSTGSNSLNYTLYIIDEQAGGAWHTVIDGKGYMQPDKMRGYRCEQAASGLAATRGGQSELSQLRYPYSNLSQSSWTTGSGQLVQEDPESFLYAKNLDTTVPQQMIVGPLVHQTGIAFDVPYYAPTTVYGQLFPKLATNGEGIFTYFAQKFTAPTGGLTTSTVSISGYKRTGSGTSTVSVALYTNGSSAPGTLMGSWVTVAMPGFSSVFRTVPLVQALSSATVYWVVVKTSQAGLSEPEHSIFFDRDGSYTGGAAMYSANGTNWTTHTGYSMAFKINSDTVGAMEDTVKAIKYGSVNATGVLMAIGGKRVYQWSEGDAHWDDKTTNIEVDADTDLTADATDMIYFNDKLFVAQGLSNPIRVWDGTYWGPGSNTTLVVNGTFDDADDWTADGATLTSIAGGQAGNCLSIANSGSAAGAAKQTITTVSGTWYELVGWVKTGTSSGGTAKMGTADEGTQYWDSGALAGTGWTRFHKTFKATTTTMFLSLWTNTTTNGHTMLFDTIEVREVPCANYFHIGKGYLWASTAVNNIKHTNDATSWSAAVTIGENLYDITNFVNYQGRLLVGKEDGIWEVDDADLATEYLLFREHADPDNCRGWTVWSGMLFIPVQNTIWRWQGSQYKTVGPTDKRSGPTKEWPNQISRMTATAPLLFASASPVVSTGYGGVIVYNGVGWHHLLSNTAPTVVSDAICITSEVGTDQVRVWWGEGSRINYAKFSTFTNNRYDWTSADYTDNGGTFVSSWWDGGLKDALKFWNRLTLLADIPLSTSVKVLCAKDGQDWTTSTDMSVLGELFSYNATDNGEYTLMFPDGMIAKSIQLIFILSTSNTSITPRIRAYNVESLVRQQPVYTYTFRILLANNVLKMDGKTETARLANDMWEELQRASAKDTPIIISFPQKSVRGVISYLREETSSYKADGMDDESWERVASLSVVEVT
jgi:hypothetical protein